MMRGPRAEDVQAALDYPTPREEGTTLLVIPDFILDIIKAAALAALADGRDTGEKP